MDGSEDQKSTRLGERISIASQHLGEKRPILIATPRSYAQDKDRRYPVLYVLDGETHFVQAAGTAGWLAESAGAIPEHIVVAIPNTGANRGRDLTPPPGEASGKFLDFLTTELIPQVDSTYRTQPFRILSGHSMGGIFALHGLMTRPKAFQGYLVASPYLVLNQGETLKRVAKNNWEAHMSAFLFVSMGDRDPLVQAYGSLVKSLENGSPKGLDWNHGVFPGEDHMTTPGLTLHTGLKRLYQDLQVDGIPEEKQKTVSGIKAHFKTLSETKYGYDLSPEKAVNQLAITTAQKGDLRGAISMMKINAKDHPQSWQAQVNLSSILEAGGLLDQAIKATQKAHQLAKSQNADSEEGLAMRLKQLRVRKASTAN